MEEQLESELREVFNELEKEKDIFENVHREIETGRGSEYDELWDIKTGINSLEKRTKKCVQELERGNYYSLFIQVYEMKELNEKIGPEILDTLKNIIQGSLGNSRDSKKLYKKVEALERHMQKIDSDLVNKCAKWVREKGQKKYSRMPKIYIEEPAFNAACQEVLDYAPKETAGIFQYRRVSDGLILYDHDKLSGIERGSNRVDTQEAERDLARNQEEKRISYHSHPPDGGIILSGAPSAGRRVGSGDVADLVRRGDGIEILAKPGEDQYKGELLWAACVLRAPQGWRESNDSVKVDFLPFHIASGDDIVTSKYPIIQTYNTKLKKFYAGSTVRSPYRIEEKPLSIF